MEDHLEQDLDSKEESTSGRPSGRTQRTHRSVMTAAAELLAENGYASITIEAIAAKVSVAKTTIYRWWPTKSAIFMELYNELAAQTLTTLDTGSVEEDLRHKFAGNVQIVYDNQCWFGNGEHDC